MVLYEQFDSISIENWTSSIMLKCQSYNTRWVWCDACDGWLVINDTFDHSVSFTCYAIVAQNVRYEGIVLIIRAFRIRVVRDFDSISIVVAIAFIKYRAVFRRLVIVIRKYSLLRICYCLFNFINQLSFHVSEVWWTCELRVPAELVSENCPLCQCVIWVADFWFVWLIDILVWTFKVAQIKDYPVSDQCAL